MARFDLKDFLGSFSPISFTERFGVKDFGKPAPPAAPTIGNFVPADGTPIVSAAALQLDLTWPSASAIVSFSISVTYSDRAPEVVFDGKAFTAGFAGTVSTISGGLRYNWTRVGGYKATPSIVATAVDSFGQVTRT